MRRGWRRWLTWSGLGLAGLGLLAAPILPLPSGAASSTDELLASPTPALAVADLPPPAEAGGGGDQDQESADHGWDGSARDAAPEVAASQAASTPIGESTVPPATLMPTPTVQPTASPTPLEPAPAPVPPGPQRISDAPPPEVTADYVAILDEASGQLLYGHDEHARVAPASVTKIATALVALEREPNLARRIAVSVSGSAMNRRDGSSIMGLEPGLSVSLETLLYGLMLPSGNDAAEQLALTLAGSRQTYVGWMNQKVAELGLRDTHFVNPSGMDAAGHYSSAYDLARLGRAAMGDQTFRRLAGALTYAGDDYNLKNLNRLLGAYPGADGIKIGRTPAAGRTIVASATRDGHRVYVSLLHSEDLPGDSAALFDWVWQTFTWLR